MGQTIERSVLRSLLITSVLMVMFQASTSTWPIRRRSRCTALSSGRTRAISSQAWTSFTPYIASSVRVPNAGGYRTEPVQNRLRQALHPEHYTDVFDIPGDPSRHDHIGMRNRVLSTQHRTQHADCRIVGHCIDHIRQALQCHADLTPMRWKQVGDRVVLEPTAQHTCRNFDQLHGWAQARQTRLREHASIRNGSLFVID